MKRYPHSKTYLIDPRSIWQLWTLLQNNTEENIHKNPPSSGFIGKFFFIICRTYYVKFLTNKP